MGYPKTIWREISTKKSFKWEFSTKKSKEKSLQIKNLKAIWTEKMKRHLHQKNCKQSWQEAPFLYTYTYVYIYIFSSSKRNRKIVWGNMPTQKSLKRNLYQKNIWRISPTKKSNNFSTKPTKETLKVHSLPKTYPTPIAWTACDLDFLVRKPNLGGAPSRKYQKNTKTSLENPFSNPLVLVHHCQHSLKLISRKIKCQPQLPKRSICTTNKF